MAQDFGKRVEHRRHPRRVAAPEHPGRLLVDIAVGVGDDAPDRLEREVERLVGKERAEPLQEPPRLAQQLFVCFGKCVRLRHRRVAIAVDHRQDALRQIAVIIGEIAIEPADDRAVRKIAVAAERQFAQHEIAHGIKPIVLDQRVGRDEIAERF